MMKDKIILKAFAISILPLVSIFLILFFGIKYIYFIDLITIKEYKTLCCEYIYDEVRKEEFYITHGIIITKFDHQEFALVKSFYEKYTIDKGVILSYLDNKIWFNIIRENKFQCDVIKELIFDDYKKYIILEEMNYNIAITTKYNIQNAKIDAETIIYDYLKLLLKTQEFSSLLSYVSKIIDGVDWVSYIQSIDYQSGELFWLKHFSKEKILHETEMNCVSSSDSSLYCNIIQFFRVLGVNVALAQMLKTLLIKKALISMYLTNPILFTKEIVDFVIKFIDQANKINPILVRVVAQMFLKDKDAAKRFYDSSFINLLWSIKKYFFGI